MAVCVAAGGAVVALALQTFTLAWTHSIEKVRWEEDWRVDGERLVLVQARVRGSGAGMEPPAGSIFEHGVWRYDPHVPPLDVLRLTHSRFAAGYEFCHDGGCAPLVDAAPAVHDGDVIELRVCAPR